MYIILYNWETKVPQPVYITYMNWLYIKIFALLSWVLIFAYFSLLFQNITTYSLEIWVQRLKPKLCGMPSRPLGKYRKSTTIYHIFTTAYYVHTLSQWGQRLFKFALLLSFFYENQLRKNLIRGLKIFLNPFWHSVAFS